jgi:hypothetical protein
MESLARTKREYELVRLMLGDRAEFRAECLKALGLSNSEGWLRLDCDLIRAILDREFPPLSVRWCLPTGKYAPTAI